MRDLASASVLPATESPPNSGPSLVALDLHVTYRVYEDRHPTLRGLVANGFKPRRFRAVEAVRGVTLAAYPGEAVALIGRNGAGKSTLLRAIAGLLPATSGVTYARSVPVLLGVRAALQPNLSGRRNIILGCTALGLSRKEAVELAPKIISYSGLDQYIDMPMRAYSSGMTARLQFAIASSVEPEVLLIDEALAVGDAEFRRKSRKRVKKLIGRAGTVFVVSHGTGTLRAMCTRAVWLDAGRIVMDGDVDEVIPAYEDATGGAEDGP